VTERLDRSLFVLDLTDDDAARVAVILRALSRDPATPACELIGRIADQLEQSLTETTEGSA